MAKKRLTDVPSAKVVRQLLAKREFAKAAEEARKLSGFTPGPEASALLREALSAQAEASLERKQYANFNRLALELEPLCVAAGSEAILALGRLYLRGAKPRELPRLIALLTDPADAAALRGDWVDHTVRERDPQSLPEEWQGAYAALRTALGHYEAKADDKAREALNNIGLGSPFLEWKLWLRGLLAWVAGDDGRALENWTRLNPQRLPHQLAAPLRTQAEPVWLADQPALRAQLTNRYRRLSRKDLGGKLRLLLPEMAGKKGLATAFKIVEPLLVNLRTSHPAQVSHLANVFYYAMQKRGEPGDLDRFTKAFGRLPDDPTFNRLSAQIFEGIGEPEKSATQWWSYCNWLEHQAPWPPLLRRRALAIVTRKMADQVAGCDSGRLIIARTKQGDPKAKLPDIILDEDALLLKAIGYAPDWEEPAAALMDIYLDENRAAEAIAFAEKYLATNPGAAEVMEGYVEALRRGQRFEDALRHFVKLQKAKPFDKDLRAHTAECVLYLAYQRIQANELSSAQLALDEHREFLAGEFPQQSAHLQYALAKKAKRTEEAATYLGQLGSGVEAAFLSHVNASILKAKPAEKTAASKAYKAALAAGPSAAEAIALHARYQFLEFGGIAFMGRNALLKGIVDALLNSVSDPALTEAQATELIGRAGPNVTLPKFDKLATALAKRFPKSPVFLLATVELWYSKNPRKRAPQKIVNTLRRAKDLVRNSTEPSYKLLEDRIDELLEELDPYINLRNMFDSFF